MGRIVILYIYQQRHHYERTAMTFMQQYREFKRMNTQVRATLDERVVRQFGSKLAGQFERMSKHENQIVGFNVNVRINYRSEAAKRSDWPTRSNALNKMWFSFR